MFIYSLLTSVHTHTHTRSIGLPFRLVDSKRWLIRQDVVTRLVWHSCVYTQLSPISSALHVMPTYINGWGGWVLFSASVRISAVHIWNPYNLFLFTTPFFDFFFLSLCCSCMASLLQSKVLRKPIRSVFLLFLYLASTL